MLGLKSRVICLASVMTCHKQSLTVLEASACRGAQGTGTEMLEETSGGRPQPTELLSAGPEEVLLLGGSDECHRPLTGEYATSRQRW